MTMSLTENGAVTHASSGSAVLDLFANVGASRGNTSRLADMWWKAYMSHPDLAVRVALWARDIRGGAGEREAFRALLKAMDSRETFDVGLLKKIAEVGRADDLFVIEKNFPLMAAFYKEQIDAGARAKVTLANIDNMTEEECAAMLQSL